MTPIGAGPTGPQPPQPHQPPRRRARTRGTLPSRGRIPRPSPSPSSSSTPSSPSGSEKVTIGMTPTNSRSNASPEGSAVMGAPPAATPHINRTPTSRRNDSPTISIVANSGEETPIRTEIEGRVPTIKDGQLVVERAMREFEKHFPNGQWCPPEYLPETLSLPIIGAFRNILKNWLAAGRAPTDLWAPEGPMMRALMSGREGDRRLSQSKTRKALDWVLELTKGASSQPATSSSQLRENVLTGKRQGSHSSPTERSNKRAKPTSSTEEASMLLSDFRSRWKELKNNSLQAEAELQAKIDATKEDSDTLKRHKAEAEAKKQRMEALTAQLNEAKQEYAVADTNLRQARERNRADEDEIGALKESSESAKQSLQAYRGEFMAMKRMFEDGE